MHVNNESGSYVILIPFIYLNIVEILNIVLKQTNSNGVLQHIWCTIFCDVNPNTIKAILWILNPRTG